jgi:transcriptional regulator with XRE-family HTH domain
MSGLSLRTIQRLEAGHRVSYASLRALATAFDIEVDSLERELYAMNQSTDDDFVESPRWLRLMTDRLSLAGRRLTRRDFRLIEGCCIACAAIVFAVSFLVAQHARAQVVRTLAVAPMLSAYLVSLNIGMFDKYKLWPGSRNATAETHRTWRNITAEYVFLLVIGLLGTVVIMWLFV